MRLKYLVYMTMTPTVDAEPSANAVAVCGVAHMLSLIPRGARACLPSAWTRLSPHVISDVPSTTPLFADYKYVTH